MSYIQYDNMSTSAKDKLVDGMDIQMQIEKYNMEKKIVNEVRTPKRHHSGEQTTNIDEDLIMSPDADKNKSEVSTHQRKRFLSENKDYKYQGENDVIHRERNMNHTQLSQQAQKRRTTSSRTFINGEYASMNQQLKRNEKQGYEGEKDKTNQSKSQVDKHQSEENQMPNQHQDRSQDEHHSNLFISDHALHYAIDQHLPPINIKCQPKVFDQKQATILLKDFFFAIEKDFKKRNCRYTKPLSFEYWYIDRDNNLQCFTREIELFVFLCDIKNYPDRVRNTTLTPNPPKHLPPQRSVIMKFVPKEINIDDIKSELLSKYQSLFNIEEMRGTISGKNRHIRIDISAHDEYMKILNSGVISIGSELLEVSEFLAPPRLLICSRCNTPGHIKKDCKNDFDRCRRCGENKSQGEHKECSVKCHHCNGDHESTSYQCPIVAEFRKELIFKLKSKSNLLPRNVQLFIPSEYRTHGSKNSKILMNNTPDARLRRLEEKQAMSYHTNEWPNLPTRVGATTTSTWCASTDGSDIWNEMSKAQKEFELLKEKFAKQEMELTNKYNEQKLKLGSILSLMSVQLQQQNEGLKSISSTVYQLIPMITKSLEICHLLFIKATSQSTDQNERSSSEIITQQIQSSIALVEEQHKIISCKHAQLFDQFESNNQLLQQGVKRFLSVNE